MFLILVTYAFKMTILFNSAIKIETNHTEIELLQLLLLLQ